MELPLPIPMPDAPARRNSGIFIGHMASVSGTLVLESWSFGKYRALRNRSLVRIMTGSIACCVQ